MLGERCRFRPVSPDHRSPRLLGPRLSCQRRGPRPAARDRGLIAAALAGPAPATILDLGTGSGVIILTLLAEWPAALGSAPTSTPPPSPSPSATPGPRDRRRRGPPARATGTRLSRPASTSSSRTRPMSPAEMLGLAADVLDWEPRPRSARARPASRPTPRSPPASASSPGGRALFEIGPTQASPVAALFAALGFDGACVHKTSTGATGSSRWAARLAEFRLRSRRCLYALGDPATIVLLPPDEGRGSDTCTDTSGFRDAAARAARAPAPAKPRTAEHS